MPANHPPAAAPLSAIVLATDEAPLFQKADTVRVLTRTPIGHYRVPLYLRGKRGTVDAVLAPRFVDNEQEGYGRNAGSARDQLRIEVYETWLERI